MSAKLLQGRFVDVRMQDCYNVVKCLQDLTCLDASTASYFFELGGFSNLSALLSWPEADMRHARWAAAVVLKDVRHTLCLIMMLVEFEQFPGSAAFAEGKGDAVIGETGRVLHDKTTA